MAAVSCGMTTTWKVPEVLYVWVVEAERPPGTVALWPSPKRKR
jgi:hypothetical protein